MEAPTLGGLGREGGRGGSQLGGRKLAKSTRAVRGPTLELPC